MVMIESLARGTPVVVTPCGAAPEIVDHGITGFVRSTVAGLAIGVNRAPTLDRDACRAAAAAERFSSERLVAEHIKCYEQAIAGTWAPTRTRARATRVA